MQSVDQLVHATTLAKTTFSIPALSVTIRNSDSQQSNYKNVSFSIPTLSITIRNSVSQHNNYKDVSFSTPTFRINTQHNNKKM